MKKTLIMLFVLLTVMSTTVSAQSLGVFTWDSKGKFTNVRNAPNGKVVDRIPTSEAAMIGVEKPTNGWWKIDGNDYDTGDFQGTLKGSSTGYWIHYSVLAMGTRNYGKEKLTLRKSPDAKSAAVYSFTEEILLRPMEIKDDWVKVKTIDGKYTGWIEVEWLCGNSLTNCC
jgi:SH3-like domain-containing protein